MSLFVKRTAHFSPCRRWRYWLRIVWDELKPLLVVCGLNPSTADEYQDDPTLRRVQGFARDMGRGGVLMLNAFAWRDTDPKGLLSSDDPVGPENTIANFRQWIGDQTPVAAWGGNIARKQLRYRAAQLLAIKWDCFRMTSRKDPEHPLYLPASCRPIPWNYVTTTPTVPSIRHLGDQASDPSEFWGLDAND